MKFANSLYELLKQSPTAMQKYVDSTLATKFDNQIWKQLYDWDMQPSSIDGFKAVEVVQAASVMADIRARFSPVAQRDTDGIEFYQGTIPDLSHGFKESVEDRVRFREMLKYFNGDTQILAQFTNNLVTYVGGIHSRITNMGMQLASSGEIVYDSTNQGTGTPFRSKAPVPSANFKTAGVAAWSDNTNAKIITDMQNIQDYMRGTLGYTGALEWNVDRYTMNNILRNKEVKDNVVAVLSNIGAAVVPTAPITENQLNTFLQEYRIIAPIKVYDEGQNLYSEGGVITPVSGWKEGRAILRPAGKVGVVKYNPLYELAEVQGQQGINITTLEMGRIGIKSKFNPATETWTTDILAAAIPTLRAWNYHIIVDTKTAED